MDATFWLDRWARKQIGFHQPHVSSYLERWWPRVHAPSPARVLVPLCGKTLDIVWLRAQGHHVVGVELAPQAISEFFAEHELTPHITRQAPFERWDAPGVTLLCGDFFELTPADVPDIDVVFDRAALIALPAHMRGRYVEHLRKLTTPQTMTLLIGVTYAQHEMNGPPFSVPAAEIETLFGASHDIELLESVEVLDENPKFRDRGLSRMSEQVYLLRTRNRRT